MRARGERVSSKPALTCTVRYSCRVGEIDADSVREQVLAEARAGDEERTLDVAAIDPDDVPEGGGFPDRSVTRRPVPLGVRSQTLGEGITETARQVEGDDGSSGSSE